MKSIAIFVAIIAAFIGLFLYKFHVPSSPKISHDSLLLPVVHNFAQNFGQFMEDLGICSRATTVSFLLGFKSDWVHFLLDTHTIYEDTKISDVPVRVYRPKNVLSRDAVQTHPAIIYFHGGGLVALSAKSFLYEKVCALISNATNSVIYSVDYRLIPEHLFPAQFDDCYAVTLEIIENPWKYGVSQGKVVILGDSAGGLLAAAVTNQLTQEGKSNNIAAQILICPWLQLIDQTYLPSYQDYADGFCLSREAVSYGASVAATGTQQVKQEYLSGNVSRYFMCTKYWEYLGLPGRSDCETKLIEHLPTEFVQTVTDPRMSPLLAENMQGLPATFIVTAEYDVIVSESKSYALRLKKAGVRVQHNFYKSYHDFFVNVAVHFTETAVAKEAVSDIAQYINKVFDNS